MLHGFLSKIVRVVDPSSKFKCGRYFSLFTFIFSLARAYASRLTSTHHQRYFLSRKAIQSYENSTNKPRKSSAENADEKEENDGYGREYKDDFAVVFSERTGNKRVFVFYVAR